MGVGGGWRVSSYTHVHACTCMHAHAHACMVNMVISCKWPPPLGKSLGIPYDVIHACVHVHVRACACMCTWVGFEICGDSPTHGWVYNFVGGWVGGWVDGWGQVKSLKI